MKTFFMFIKNIKLESHKILNICIYNQYDAVTFLLD